MHSSTIIQISLSLNQFLIGFAISTLIMLLLAIAFTYFFLNYQRKLQKQQQVLQQLEKQFQERLLIAAITSQETERSRIAADLHDEIGPLLSSVSFYLQDQLPVKENECDEGGQIIVKAYKILRSATEQVRRITYDLAPYSLDKVGLEGALKTMLLRHGTEDKLEVDLFFIDAGLRLTAQQELMLFRIIQEIINNVEKHSHSTFINISQYLEEAHYVIEVQHDGTGLDQPTFDRLRQESAGMGLKNIYSRLQLINGRLLFDKEESLFITRISIPFKQARIERVISHDPAVNPPPLAGQA